MKIKAYAKINWFLEITGKRPDGYHTLETIFQTISLADELTFREAAEFRLVCGNELLPADNTNLVAKAALRFAEKISPKPTFDVYLHKVVPMGAGLGGGSADAAAVLRVLKDAQPKKPSDAVLRKCAVSLGADVPFFLEGGMALGKGIGDELTPLPAPDRIWLILVYPQFGVSTKEAYGRVRVPVQDPRKAKAFLKRFQQEKMKDWAPYLFNRFEEFVFPQFPELPKLKSDLINAGCQGALMSGSGSTVFGVVRSPSEGRQILAKIKNRYPQSWLVHTI